MSSLNNVNKEYRSGFVALVGRANVGKSTLLNQLVGKKVSITSPIAQTTRNRLRAVLTKEMSQMIFVDTPGIHKPHHLLGERLVQSAKKSIGEVDCILLVFEGSQSPGKGDAFVTNLVHSSKIPILIVLNKWDLVDSNSSRQRREEYQELFDPLDWPIFCCSAKNGSGCNQLINSLENVLPFGPQLYPSNIISDQPEKLLLSEMIREQVLIHTREEIPHSVAVQIDRIEENQIKKTKLIRTEILATVLVERKSQKGILIGKGGSMLKIIGQGARLQMQKLINGPVHLELFVKVSPNWRSNSSRLAELGYEGK